VTRMCMREAVHSRSRYWPQKMRGDQVLGFSWASAGDAAPDCRHMTMTRHDDVQPCVPTWRLCQRVMTCAVQGCPAWWHSTRRRPFLAYHPAHHAGSSLAGRVARMWCPCGIGIGTVPITALPAPPSGALGMSRRIRPRRTSLVACLTSHVSRRTSLRQIGATPRHRLHGTKQLVMTKPEARTSRFQPGRVSALLRQSSTLVLATYHGNASDSE
jgi:hypothetical protein